MATKPAGRVAPRLSTELLEWDGRFVDDARIVDVVLSADLSARACSHVELTGCRLRGTQLTGTHLRLAHLTNCSVVGSDFSGVVLEDCVLSRVEFRGCRLSGLQAAGSRFRDVAFFDCKLPGANFRMTNWERSTFESCELIDADFYAAALPASRFLACDLTGVGLSKSTMAGSDSEVRPSPTSKELMHSATRPSAASKSLRSRWRFSVPGSSESKMDRDRQPAIRASQPARLWASVM